LTTISSIFYSAGKSSTTKFVLLNQIAIMVTAVQKILLVIISISISIQEYQLILLFYKV
jgi:hypothetical protein